MLCSLSIICGPYACLDNFIMLASSVKDSRSFKHGFIFAGLLHSNSLWLRLFVYGSGIPVMPQDFFFLLGIFLYHYCCYYIIGKLGKIRPNQG